MIRDELEKPTKEELIELVWEQAQRLTEIEQHVALASVIDTAKLQGRSPFKAIQQLFSPPALPIPVHTSCT